MCSSYDLTENEIELLDRYYKFYRALETGERTPTTSQQEHFVKVCRGLSIAQTEHEIAYAKFMRNRAQEQHEKYKLMQEESQIPDLEEGYPTADWFTDADMKKLHAQEFRDLLRRHR